MRELFDNYSRFLSVVRGFDAERRASDAEDFSRRARNRALRIEREHLERPASGALGDAALGTLADAKTANLLDPTGLFLGALGRTPLYLNSDGHHLVYARTGAGKGVTSAQPNLAHFTGSMFVIDVKDGELHYSSGEHRRDALGQKVVTLDPWAVRGNPGARVSPLQRLADITANGGRIDAEADEIALILIPKGKGPGGDTAWVGQGARRMLATRMKYLAYTAPERLSLCELWRFVNASDADTEAAFAEMQSSPREDIAGSAAALRAAYDQAAKQFEAYRAECIDALQPFSPGGALAHATSGNEVDFAEMKREGVTVYLVVPSAKIGVAASWLAMILNHAIEQIAAASGSNKVRFLLDEIAQLPPVPALTKALRLYRGRGIQLSLYCQGRFSLRDAGYSESIVKEIEDQASCMQLWGVEDPSLIKDIELWSGNTSIVQVEPSHSGGQVAHGSFGRREQKRPLLQAEDIRAINEGRQIIKLPGFPLFVANRIPYWKVSPWKSQLRDVREWHSDQEKL